MRYREHKNETGTQGASQTRYQPISIWHQDNRPIAAGFGVEVASHGGGCANLHMLLATPNAIYAECGSLKSRPSTLEALRMVMATSWRPRCRAWELNCGRISYANTR